MESIVYYSIRCGVWNGGYWGSDQGESGLNSHQPSVKPLASEKVGRQTYRRFARAKKCGAESGDPNLRFQPRLPGSVVGEASMR